MNQNGNIVPGQPVQPAQPVQQPIQSAQSPVQAVVEPTTGSSVVVDRPAAESDGAGELMRKAAEYEQKKQKRKSKLRQKFDNLPPNKKKIILIGTISGAAVLVIVLSVVINVLANRVNYQESYKVAKELKIEVQAMKSSDACDRVVSYVESTYTTMRAYNEYVENCRTVGADAKELVEELGKTEGVMKDEAVKSRYDQFVEAFNTATAGSESLDELLSAYAVWHNWILTSYELDSWDQTDADLQSAAKILTNSDVELFMKYGEGWLPLKQAAAKAYREYYASSILAENKAALYDMMVQAQKDFSDWNSENKPSIKDELVLERKDMAKMNTKFDEFYKYLATTYAKHYVKGSGDCKETLGEVVCE